MINRLYLFAMAILLSPQEVAFAQQKVKPDLYIYFKADSLNGIHKTTLKTKGVIRGKNIQPDKDYDIYNYSYISDDRKKKYHLMLFSTINKNEYCMRDSIFINSHKILPYKNLEKIKGLITDDWNSKTTPFKRVFLVEKIANNQFKVIPVTLYYPFNSNGVEIELIK